MHDLPQGQAVDQLHGEEHMSVVLTLVVDRDDIGVAQSGRGARLAAELLDEGLILGKVGAHDLERDLAIEPLVQGDVHRRHPAVGQVREHAIAPVEDMTDEGEGIGGRHVPSLRNSAHSRRRATRRVSEVMRASAAKAPAST
jgi:hypothetical protein